MYKIVLFLVVINLPFFHLNAQTQFENPGFEQWEAIDIGPVPEPVNWSSLRTALPLNLAQVSPAVWDSSTDAHSGNYSLYLINKSAFNIVATGTMTNGRIFANLNPDKAYTFTDPNDSRWNTPLPHRPDSVTGWFKCKPSEGDFATVKAILYTDSISVPGDTTNWIAVAYFTSPLSDINSWTRFSVPFNYYKPDIPGYILIILTSGNGTSAIAESEAWFDDLELIYNDGTAVNEIKDNDLKVYASHKTVTVFITGNSRHNIHLQVMDLTGKPVYTTDFNSGQKEQFDLNVPEGIYIVVANTGQKVLTRKIMLR